MTFRPGLTLVVGANGLGKTTLITLIFRLLAGPYDIGALGAGEELGFRRLSAAAIPPYQRVLLAARVDDIKRVIEKVHEHNLCTPDAQVPGNSMWADAANLHAMSNAEAIAQAHLKTALSVALFNCDIRHEQKSKAGRVDLEVVQILADGASVTPAEIEIKVLRARNKRGKSWSAAQNEKWMRRGIRQAAAYRDVRRARAGMLCCFDMRAADIGDVAAFAPVRDFAAELSVELHRSFLFNDSEAYRVARYGT